MTAAKLAIKTFASVKLPESLVQQAKEAAQPLRRSAAGQIEYWATLGRVVEHSGLTELEALEAIKLYEVALRLNSQGEDSQAGELTAQFMANEADGSLAERVRKVIAENRNKTKGIGASETLSKTRDRVLEISANGSLQKRIRKVVASNKKLAESRPH